MTLSFAQGSRLLAAVSAWLLATSLGHCQTISNFITDNNERDLTTVATNTVLRLQPTEWGQDPHMSYSSIIGRLRGMVGQAVAGTSYRELVDSPDYLYVPFASMNDEGTNMETLEQGFFLNKADLYVVAARVGHTYRSFGPANSYQASFRAALDAMPVPAGITRDIAHVESMNINYPTNAQDFLNAVGLSPMCLDFHLQAVLNYVASGEGQTAANTGLRVAFVALAEAMRFGPVETRIEDSLNTYSNERKLAFAPASAGELGRTTLAAYLPLKWSAVSEAVRDGSGTIPALNVYYDNGDPVPNPLPVQDLPKILIRV